MLMMLPFEAPTIFEGIHKSYFRMPRVVKDQRSKFENDDLFRQLSHESAVKYTGFKDRPLEERQMKFISNCQEGHTEVSVVQSGNQFTLMFNPTANPAYNNEGCDFDKELGKVHIKSGFILNGVCVLWRGWLDLQRLEGFGCLEFDEYRAYLEEAMLKQQIDKQQQQSACNTSQLQLQQQQATSNHLNHQPSPLGRLNAHPPIAAPQPQQQQQPPPQHHPLAHLPPVGQSALQPPVSLADSYGNAAIAAAAAAAFHQALGVQPPASYAPPALLPVAGAAHLPPAAYLNGAPATTTAAPPLGIQARVSPPTSNHHQPQQPHQIRPLSNGTSNASGNSPEHQHQQQYQPQQRQSLKRSLEPPDQTQLDEVDVVSDIHAHDLDFPPRRIFKSAPITSNHHAHHHHQPLTTATHRATRRA